jgi:hypothetical protein
MTRNSIREYAAAVRPRYQRAGRREKGQLLDRFCEVTGYHRKAAIRLLSAPPAEARGGRGGPRRGRPPTYGPEVQAAVTQVWTALDRPCGKRLAPFLPTIVPHLEVHGELTLPEPVRRALLGLSAATIDRLLAPARQASPRQPRSHQPATGPLRAQIPVRTFGDWADAAPGEVQADLVLHCGPSTEGFYLSTLVLVDVVTGWTELEAVWGIGQERVGSAVHRSRDRLPLPLRSLHTDNGSAFLNHRLVPWCRREGIALTRGRPYRKNDQAWVEQRNWQVVRRLVGYDRFHSHAAHTALARLYDVLRLYINFFQPIAKLIHKERRGARVIKRYDRAQTPYQRLCATGLLSPLQLEGLDRLQRRLNPVALRATIDRHLTTLWSLATPGGDTLPSARAAR